MNEPLTMADVEDALHDLWDKVGPDQFPKGVAIMGPEWRGHLWIRDDGVFRGELRHSERGIFSASKVEDGPVVIEGWDDSWQD